MDSPSPAQPRRHFLKQSLVASMGAAAVGPNLLLGQAKGANERVRVGVMGLGRGRGHIKALVEVPNAEVAYVCDVDSNRLETGLQTIADKQEKLPEKVGDFRRILDDPNIDAITIAAPNYWHTPAAILACQAGKHVYVEKPGSHNAYEALKLVEVAKATDRRVQLGTQRRSYSGMIEGMQKLREGAIGTLRYARCWYASTRDTIGTGKPAPVPPELDYTLWQGPLPERPYIDNLVHYNWHWRWFYGGGELANNGVHSLDVARWAMGVDFPQRVTCEGGRYHFDDDQETPDSCYASYDFGTSGINWSGSSCHKRKSDDLPFVSVYGDGGTMEFSSANYVIYDEKGVEVSRNKDNPSDVPHFTNFVNAIREGEALNANIADSYKSSLLCHLGNIAYRTSGAVKVNPADGTLVENPEAQKLWKREEYRKGWEI